jgi:hypothetical protein
MSTQRNGHTQHVGKSGMSNKSTGLLYEISDTRYEMGLLWLVLQLQGIYIGITRPYIIMQPP